MPRIIRPRARAPCHTPRPCAHFFFLSLITAASSICCSTTSGYEFLVSSSSSCNVRRTRVSWYDCIMHDNAKTQNTDTLAYREGQLEQCEVLPCLLDLIVVVERNRVVQVEQVVAVCGGAYDTRGSQSERWVGARPCVSCGWAHRSISMKIFND